MTVLHETQPICRISKEIEFDAGHRVQSHGSKCRNPHGHRYRVRVTCEGRIVNDPGSEDDGMLIDFGDLKTLMTTHVHDVLDHGFVVEASDSLYQVLDRGCPGQTEPWRVIVFSYPPTAENFARWCWKQLEEPIRNRFREGLQLVEVAVWETPTSVAYFTGGHQ